MIRIILFVLCFTSSSFAAYIDTRNMHNETIRIQRLLGKLDAMKIAPQSNQKGTSGTQLAMLTLMTTGLAMATISSVDRVYYDDYYYGVPRPYPGYRPRPRYRYDYDDDALAVAGAVTATAGLIGLIGSEIAEKKRQETQKAELDKIQEEINSIISNLVSTDQDFTQDFSQLQHTLKQKVEKDILAISKLMTNELSTINKGLEQKQKEFITLTNKLTTDIKHQEKLTYEAISYHITKIGDSTTSKDSIKELKLLNKNLEKRYKKEYKEYQKNLAREIKSFNKLTTTLSEQQEIQKQNIQATYNQQILKTIEGADQKKIDLFQKYITQYIQKLSVY